MTGPECATIEALEAFVEKVQGLTIIGKDSADLTTGYRSRLSRAFLDERVELVDIQDKLCWEYFQVLDSSLDLSSCSY